MSIQPKSDSTDNVASIHEHLERGLQRAAEALIFAADTPVQARDIAEVYAEVTGEDRPDEHQVAEAIERLNQTYQQTERVFRIELWAEGYRMATASSVSPFLKAYFNREQEQRLSRSLMETLSIIAYRQPVTKPEVDFIRGVDSGYAVNKLLEKGMVDVVGRSESLGRPLLYGTTSFFLEQFGLSNLEELPDLREIEEILDDPAFNKERAELLQLQELEGREGRPEGEAAPADGSSTEGSPGDGSAAEGSPADESPADGSTAEGAPVDRPGAENVDAAEEAPTDGAASGAAATHGARDDSEDERSAG